MGIQAIYRAVGSPNYSGFNASFGVMGIQAALRRAMNAVRTGFNASFGVMGIQADGQINSAR